MPQHDGVELMMLSRRCHSRSSLTAIGRAAVLVAFIIVSRLVSGAEQRDIDCHISYRTATGLYLDVGQNQGLRAGTEGELIAGGSVSMHFVVRHVAPESVFITVDDPDISEPLLAAGSGVELRFDPPAELVGPPAPPANPLDDEAEADFVPLLANDYKASKGSNTIGHGSLSMSQQLQMTGDGLLDYSRTRLGGSGTVERLDATAWAFEWSGNLYYRSGAAYDDGTHFATLQPDVHQLSLARRMDDGSLLRVGRFRPLALPGVGTLDGVHVEIKSNESLRIGSMFGFRPDRDDLDPNYIEPTAVSYGSFLWRGDQRSYTITAGMLTSLYEGQLDRMALLVDQRASLERWTVLFDSVVDFDIGGAELHDGTRLSRLDLSTMYDFESTRVEARIDRYEFVDTDAERSLFDEYTITADEYLRDTATSASLGLGHRLSDHWTIHERVSNTDARVADGVRYGVDAERRQVDWLGGGGVSFGAYNLRGNDVDGWGAHFTSDLRVSSRFSLYPSVRVRWFETGTGSESLFAADVSTRARWRLSSNWSAHAAASYAVDDDTDRLFLEVGVTLTW